MSPRRRGHEAAALATIGGTAADIRGASDVVLWGFGCAMPSLVGALLLSLYKPDGRPDAPDRSRRPRESQLVNHIEFGDVANGREGIVGSRSEQPGSDPANQPALTA